MVASPGESRCSGLVNGVQLCISEQLGVDGALFVLYTGKRVTGGVCVRWRWVKWLGRVGVGGGELSIGYRQERRKGGRVGKGGSAGRCVCVLCETVGVKKRLRLGGRKEERAACLSI